MLATIKTSITDSLTQALHSVAPDVVHPIVLERPRDASHGDVACNMAMQLAKKVGKNPRELAQALVDALPQNPNIAAIEIAGPGFMNIRLTDAAKQSVIAVVLSNPDAFGLSQTHEGEHVMLEFVSANPTGPLHVGHARQAALGDILGNVLSTQGYDVHREFYYNDAGAQINNLAISVQARAKGLGVDDPSFPADGYRGDYIVDIAQAFLAKDTVNGVTATGDVDSLVDIKDFAVAYLRNEQDLDLKAFGVEFDQYFLESSLYTSGAVEQTVNRLTELGHTYEQDGALWFRSTDFGDDKDRVMRKADGSGYTYFVPDVAYHLNKWSRGFTKVINIQGTDHHGTIARVRAGVQAADMGVVPPYPDYVLHKMVMVMKDGVEVKLSKRAGSYVTLRDLVDWTSEEAARFFLISRKADTEFVFDVDLAVSQSDENPVYYVQYAHARICSIIEKAEVAITTPAATQLAPLTAATETTLMKLMSEYADTLTAAANDLAPHHVVYYLKDLASAVHTFCGSKTERVLTDDADLKFARVHLLAAARDVLAQGLKLLGVSAPTRM